MALLGGGFVSCEESLPEILPAAMETRSLPSADTMFHAFVDRDTSFDGIFFTGVRSTGIFCRPTCPARKPKRENVEFFPSARDALAHGYRPCRRCRPMQPRGTTPEDVRELLNEIEDDPALRLRDRDLRDRGLDPATIRRWFKRHHDMTFHAYQRGRRMARALHQLGDGSGVTETAFDNGFDSVSGFNEALRQVTGRAPNQSRDAEVVHLSRIPTSLGPMLAGTNAGGVCLLEFTDRRMLPEQLRRLQKRLSCVFLPGSDEVMTQLESELESYFEGTLRTFDVPVRLLGTPFQERVWRALIAIPFGRVRSYSEQARAIGDANAVRAVARANGDNRIAIVVPCHRVIGSDGSLTGYAGGLWRKKYLLDLEGSPQSDLFPA